MKKALVIIMAAALFLSVPAFAKVVKQEKQAVKQETQKEITTSKGKVYVGMTKGDLYKIYTKSDERIFFQQGPVENITFDDWATEAAGDRITFQLENGKVKSWGNE